MSADHARQLAAIGWTRSPTTRADLLRQAINLLNLSTVVGLVVAGVGGATLSRGPHRIVIATEYRLPFPRAGAFTIGDVVITYRSRERLLSRPALLRHESRHCLQYAWCLGVVMLPLYALAAGWSWLRTGDPVSRNIFERLAGLADGDYVEHPVRPLGAQPGK